jgi:hypothetical protein
MVGLALVSVSHSYAQALTLTWDRNPDVDAVTHYQIYSCPSMTCADTALVLIPNVTVVQPAAPAAPAWVIPDGFVGRLAVTALNVAWTDTAVTPPAIVYNESDKSVSVGVNGKRGGRPTNPKIRW